MSEVKRYGHIGCLVHATEQLQELYRDMKVYVLETDYVAAQVELAALREELAEANDELDTNIHNNIDLTLRLAAAEQRNVTLGDALIKIIEMNRQQAKDQYGDAEKAESWSCITVARAALGDRNAEN